MTALTGQNTGITTRRIFLPVSDFINGLQSGGLTITQIVTEHPALFFPDAAANWCYSNFRMPIDWTGGDFTINLSCAAGGTSAGTVNQKVNVWKRRVGSVLSATADQSTTATGNPPATAAQPYLKTVTVTGSAFAAGDDILVQLYADRTTSDTNTNQHYILSVYIDYPCLV